MFSTFERRPYLKDPDLRKDTHAYLGGVSKRLGCQPIIVGGVEDHVHILAILGKSTSQAEWVKELKRVSSLWLKDHHVRDFAWQGGYGAFSVSPEASASVFRYIENQEAHHREISFKEEFLRLLAEHAMQIDPRDDDW